VSLFGELISKQAHIYLFTVQLIFKRKSANQTFAVIFREVQKKSEQTSLGHSEKFSFHQNALCRLLVVWIGYRPAS
jgi:hypothetical protein